jgi:hypothetical protein
MTSLQAKIMDQEIKSAAELSAHTAKIVERVRAKKEEEPAKPTHDSYEYKVVWISEMGQFDQHVQSLNDAGQNGWKLVSAVSKGNGLIAYMERKL